MWWRVVSGWYVKAEARDTQDWTDSEGMPNGRARGHSTAPKNWRELTDEPVWLMDNPN